MQELVKKVIFIFTNWSHLHFVMVPIVEVKNLLRVKKIMSWRTVHVLVGFYSIGRFIIKSNY